MDMVVMTLGVVIGMSLLSAMCCLCMKLSDLKMKSYIVRMASRKGVKLDLDQLEQRVNCTPSPHSKDNCTIIVPEVAIIL